MLAGKRAFEGGNVSEVLAGVIKSEPTWEALPAITPPNLRRLLQRCLRKDLTRRLHDIADARIELDETQPSEATARPTAASSGTNAHRAIILWGGSIFLVAVTGIAVWNLKPALSPGLQPVSRFTIALAPGERLAAADRIQIRDRERVCAVFSCLKAANSDSAGIARHMAFPGTYATVQLLADVRHALCRIAYHGSATVVTIARLNRFSRLGARRVGTPAAHSQCAACNSPDRWSTTTCCRWHFWAIPAATRNRGL